jgi:hypothetical protein
MEPGERLPKLSNAFDLQEERDGTTRRADAAFLELCLVFIGKFCWNW